MVEKMMMYLPMVLVVVGAASALAAGLAPLVKSEKWRARLGFAMKAFDMVHGLLGKVALNPRVK